MMNAVVNLLLCILCLQVLVNSLIVVALRYKPSWLPTCIVTAVSATEERIVCRSRYEVFFYSISIPLEALCIIAWFNLTNEVLAELFLGMRIASIILFPPVVSFIFRLIFLPEFRSVYILVRPGVLEIRGGRKLKQCGPIDKVEMGTFRGVRTIHIDCDYDDENYFYFSFKGKKRRLESFMLNAMFIPPALLGHAYKILSMPPDQRALSAASERDTLE